MPPGAAAPAGDASGSAAQRGGPLKRRTRALGGAAWAHAPVRSAIAVSERAQLSSCRNREGWRALEGVVTGLV